MAEIDITILDVFVRYVLPILIGYIFIFHLFGRLLAPLFKTLRTKLLTYTLHQYWKKIYACHKTELEQMFTPLHKLKRKDGNQKLRIVEIGIGEGANFAFYPQNCEVFGVDPEGDIEPILRENAAKYDSLELKDFKAAGAEDMSHIDDDSVDAVVSTLVLCTVEDPVKVVSEVKRILRKGGVFLFWEHVYAAGKFPLSTLQWVITKFFWFVPCSCDLTRQTWKVIEEANFSKHEYVKHRMADGVFIFWEHVYASNDKWISLMQRFLTKIWYTIFSGCNLTRKSWKYIEEAHFATHEFSTIALDVLRLVNTTLYGIATK